MSIKRFNRGLGSLLAMMLAGGCGKSADSASEWKPPEFAAAVLEKLDKNGNSLVEAAELAAAPGLKAGAKAIDTNRDGKLSKEELEARFTYYRDKSAGHVMNRELRITRNGRPLVDVEVRLVPEFFLTGVLEPATGFTDDTGSVRPSVPNEENVALMWLGYYRVEVTSSRAKLPPQLNTASTVGVEVRPYSTDDPYSDGRIDVPFRDK
jgi:EF hand